MQTIRGACDKEFEAETFDEIAEMSKAHGMETLLIGRILYTNKNKKGA